MQIKRKIFIVSILCMNIIGSADASVDCPNGYTQPSNINHDTFVTPFNGFCQFGDYTLMNVPDELYVIGDGITVGPEFTLCDNGYLLNGACVSYTTGDCISGYYDLAIDDDTFSDLTNDTCANPYSTFTKTTRCDRNPGDTCVDLPTPTVNITWDDGIGNTTTNTCVYEESVTLPSVPTRPGYTFGGWAVVQP